jgi:general secretion pathway protein C
MKKRLPLIVSFVLFMLLCGSATYWFMHLFRKAPERTLAPVPLSSNSSEISIEAATRLFGGQLSVTAASNYQLKGVIAGRDGTYGAAIIVADGKPAQALPVGHEISPGVSLKEVHPQYVMLSENGALKRINLPEAKGPQIETVTLAQPDQGSRMTGPSLPMAQPPQPQQQPPQQPPQQTNVPSEPPQSPQQVVPQPNNPLQGIVPPGQEPVVGPNGELLNQPQQHNK